MAITCPMCDKPFSLERRDDGIWWFCCNHCNYSIRSQKNTVHEAMKVAVDFSMPVISYQRTKEVELNLTT